jgi:hypothetical protein
MATARRRSSEAGGRAGYDWTLRFQTIDALARLTGKRPDPD